MIYLTEEFALPETDEEFSIVELEVGIHKRIDSLTMYGQSLDKLGGDANITARKALVRTFAEWFVKHWRTVHRISKIRVEEEKYRDGTKYRIYFTDESQYSLEIMLPEISNDIVERGLGYRIYRIIRIITNESKNDVCLTNNNT